MREEQNNIGPIISKPNIHDPIKSCFCAILYNVLFYQEKHDVTGVKQVVNVVSSCFCKVGGCVSVSHH